MTMSAMSLLWIWTHQIDPKETFLRLFRQPQSVDWLATRDPNKIYQNGRIIGTVSGEVEESNGKIIFHELSDTQELKRDMPFHYQRAELKIITIRSKIGMKSITSDAGLSFRHAVLIDVVCEKVD